MTLVQNEPGLRCTECCREVDAVVMIELSQLVVVDGAFHKTELCYACLLRAEDLIRCHSVPWTGHEVAHE